MQAALAAGVRDAPRGPVPALVRAGLEAVGAELQPRRADLRRRAAIIAGHPALRERELAKQDATARALAGALRGRGVEDVAAELAAGMAIVVLSVAFDAWLDGAQGELGALAGATLDRLAALVPEGRRRAGGSSAGTSR